MRALFTLIKMCSSVGLYVRWIPISVDHIRWINGYDKTVEIQHFSSGNFAASNDGDDPT